ncbi:MAG: sulfocyanin-like copper-binding protein [Gemmatimonadales bacterium]
MHTHNAAASVRVGASWSIVAICLAAACSPHQGARTSAERTATTDAGPTARASDSEAALGAAAAPPTKASPKQPATAAKKSTPAAGTPRADTASTPAEKPTAPAQGDWVSYDAATNTVTFKLEAGPFSFNGFTNGGATLTVPAKSTVVMNFVQNDGTPHSAEVASGEGPLPNSGGDPAIPRAYTNKVVEGLPQGAKDDIRIQAPESGTFRIVCGVPGHALSGMWLWFKIDPAAKTPTFGATKK